MLSGSVLCKGVYNGEIKKIRNALLGVFRDWPALRIWRKKSFKGNCGWSKLSKSRWERILNYPKASFQQLIAILELRTEDCDRSYMGKGVIQILQIYFVNPSLHEQFSKGAESSKMLIVSCSHFTISSPIIIFFEGKQPAFSLTILWEKTFTRARKIAIIFEKGWWLDSVQKIKLQDEISKHRDADVTV